jgi:serine protease
MQVLAGVGLPGVDRGVVADATRTPDSAETHTRQHVRSLGGPGDRTGSGGAPYVPGRVIVKFRDGVSPNGRLAALSSLSGMATRASVGTRDAYADFDVVRLDPSQDAEAVAAALAAQPDVEYAQPAYRLHTMFVPNDPLYKTKQWNLPMLDLERAWDIQPAAGSAITVAVVDSGMAFINATVDATAYAFSDGQGNNYPALGPLHIPYSAAPQLVAANRFVAPHDFIWNTNTPLDFDGHGTHVSGTIGQLTNDNIGTAGVAFNVKLMPLKAVDGPWDQIFHSPAEGTDETVARAVRYAADNGAKVINMSIGREGPPNCGTSPSQIGCAPVLEDAIRYAVGKGAFISVAAGNEFEQGNPTEVVAEIASRVAGAVSVAAVDRGSNHAYYSNTGSWIEISAPGGSERGYGADGFIWQQTFDYTFTDTFLQPPSQFTAPRFDMLAYVGYIGTSMAAPHVSGIAAMLMQQGITDPAAIEAALERFATDLGSPGRDNVFGFGLVNARNTLRGLGLAK